MPSGRGRRVLVYNAALRRARLLDDLEVHPLRRDALPVAAPAAAAERVGDDDLQDVVAGGQLRAHLQASARDEPLHVRLQSAGLLNTVARARR